MIYNHNSKDQITKDEIQELLFLWQHSTATPVHLFIVVVPTHRINFKKIVKGRVSRAISPGPPFYGL